MDLVYQKTEQLRDMTILDMDNPPGIFNIRLNGLKEAGNGMYKAEEVMERITEAEDRYDSIIERYELHKAA